MTQQISSLRPVLDRIESRKQEILGFLADIVQIPSVTGDEGAVQVYLASHAESMGLRVDVFEPDWEALKQHPDYVPVSRGYEGRPNVVAVLKGTGGGRSLVLNGHVDVIPEGAQEAWEHDPWSATVVDGKMYGRGTSDMKAGVAAMTMAVEAIVRSDVKLAGDVILQYVVDEELSGNGTLACITRGHTADAGICCETSGLHVEPASVGRIWFEITVSGKAAGIQRRWEGVNAIEKGAMVCRIVSEFEVKRLEYVRHPLYPDIRATIPCMVGAMESGTYHSAFPDTALLKGSIATVPGEDSDQIKAEFVAFIKEQTASDPWLKDHPPEVVYTGYFAEPSAISTDSPIVRTLCNAFQKTTGSEPVVDGRQGAADIRFLNGCGKTPTVIFGPGLTEQMHAGNEWVRTDDVITATKVLATAILDWCGTSNE